MKNIDYNAKGQRTRSNTAMAVTTTYDYDPITFRLTHLLTRATPPLVQDDCPQLSRLARLPGAEPALTPTIPRATSPRSATTPSRRSYFNNKRVEPIRYTYDAIYRLIEATGREHLGRRAAAQCPTRH